MSGTNQAVRVTTTYRCVAVLLIAISRPTSIPTSATVMRVLLLVVVAVLLLLPWVVRRLMVSAVRRGRG